MTSANWEEEFDIRMAGGGQPDNSFWLDYDDIDRQALKSFIQSLLDKQKEEILEKLTLEEKEEFQIDTSLTGDYSVGHERGELTGYNQAVSELNELKKIIN